MIGHLDCSTGVSGDKLLGALLDAGTALGTFTADHLISLAHAVVPDAAVTVEPVSSRGIRAMGVRVTARGAADLRHWRDIRLMLENAPLPPRVRADSLRALGMLAEAEAQVHGCATEDVHFHEIGALDTIVDVVGTCAGLEALGISALTHGRVATGWGTVETSHGTLPVPAPATAALLTGLAIEPGPMRPDGSSPGELSTPTGAALLCALAEESAASPAMRIATIGYGAGTRDIGHPNVCRLLLGAPAAPLSLAEQPVMLLETNIDHISPEAAAFAVERLLDEGALDVWLSPVTMKKGRAGFVLSALSTEARGEEIAERVAMLTGSLGVRTTQMDRLVAERSIVKLDTPHGPVRYKVGAERVRPEADDVALIARVTGREYRLVERELCEFFAENR